MKNSSHQAKDITHAATLFFTVRALVRTRLAEGKKLDPFAWMRIETLLYIRDHKGPSMRAIAEHLSITAPSATSLISGMEKGGLVARKSDPADKRAVRVYLTKKGTAILEAKIARGMRVFGELFAVLSSQDLKAFIRALERIQGGCRR